MKDYAPFDDRLKLKQCGFDNITRDPSLAPFSINSALVYIIWLKPLSGSIFFLDRFRVKVADFFFTFLSLSLLVPFSASLLDDRRPESPPGGHLRILDLLRAL